ncbi:dTDP-4-dehydrorhamnose 3,5-epimerase family protein [Streptomyces sp. NPDC101150]|uniref:dTDP-4-dehydrorhamnose 3,5-epimerase family protein n=1 Tax=Streptomyces sp. NPDC101150 TaxID=3366114 RepID=UPI0038148010
MQFRELAVTGGFVFAPQPLQDKRGMFVSPLQEKPFLTAVGHPFPVAQSNHIASAKGVLRGLHFTTTPPGQEKYVYCMRGRALDVIVDLRVGSPTFGRWDAVELDSQSFRAVYFPKGTGHAFLSLEDDTVMSYLVSTGYRPELEQAIDPHDGDLRLPWRTDIDVILSERDLVAPSFREAHEAGLLPQYADCR